jgi:integrase
MATPKKSKNGNWTLFVTHKAVRCQLTLGKIERAEAMQFAANVDLLASRQKHSVKAIPASIESWVQNLTVAHREQLAKIGFLSRFNPYLTVRDLIDLFLEDYELRKQKNEIRASSVKNFKSCMLRLPKHFLNTMVNEIEPKRQSERINSAAVFSIEAKKMFVKLESWQREHYSPASWSRANGRLREVGSWAVRQGICDFSPFSLLPFAKSINSDRNLEVDRQWVLDALEHCQHPDTRLLLVLARFCGLRMLSEARTIRPQDIDWDAQTLQILDSKKRIHRTMPLFKLVAEELLRHKRASNWNRYVLSDFTLGSTDQNATKFMKAAVTRAGYEPWVKFNMNMRSSCENDLLRQGFSERLVTQWIGHTVEISRAHYQKLFTSDYRDAVERATF